MFDYARESLSVTEQTQATIINVILESDYYDLRVQFIDKNANNQTTWVSIESSVGFFHTGDKIKILYDPRDPTNALYPSDDRLKPNLGLTASILGGIGTAFGLALIKGKLH